jgi:hypothetical protein
MRTGTHCTPITERFTVCAYCCFSADAPRGTSSCSALDGLQPKTVLSEKARAALLSLFITGFGFLIV